MDNGNRAALAGIIVECPAWVRSGLAVEDQRLRERAADALAAIIVERMARAGGAPALGKALADGAAAGKHGVA